MIKCVINNNCIVGEAWIKTTKRHLVLLANNDEQGILILLTTCPVIAIFELNLFVLQCVDFPLSGYTILHQGS